MLYPGVFVSKMIYKKFNSMRNNLKLRLAVILFFITATVSSGYATEILYKLDSIQNIKIYLSQPNWEYQLDTAKLGSDGYLMADSVVINGTKLDSVGVKYKGNSSYDSSWVKNPFTISLDEYKSQTYNGYKTLKLSNGYEDPSLIREVLSYKILSNYMDCPLANFAKIYINDVYIGIYSNVENINKAFCSKYFSSSGNTLIKCNPTVTDLTYSTKSNLKYISSDTTAYEDYYEMKTDYGWEDLTNLCDTVTNHQSNLSSIMDVDRLLWMMAFDNVLVNLDSYIGLYSQNYFLYKDNNNRYLPIVWDLNMSFGGFPYAGYSNTSSGSRTITQMQQFAPTYHSTDTYWPLINIVMNNTTYKNQYIAHMKTLLQEMFTSGYYLTMADSLQKLISTEVAADTNKFFTDTDFANSLTTDIASTNFTIPGIQSLMSARITYLSALASFTSTAPTMSNITLSKTSPIVGDSVSFTVTGTNLSSMYMGYRFAKTEKFSYQTMYDDGLHNDGASGDGVYGTKVLITGTSCQYYFYAENSNAGAFSPARAEHEFYTLAATKSGLPTKGEVVINEFVASNTKGVTNPSGAYADWIELYNTTGKTLDLYGLYITDSYSNATQYAFVKGTKIEPYGYLTIWADGVTGTDSSVVRVPFKLSKSGEVIMISDGVGGVIDSLTFSTQADDVSWGRCPNGTGSFSSLSTVTYGSANSCTTSISESQSFKFKISPNPADYSVTITVPEAVDATIYSVNGNVILERTLYTGNNTINTESWSAGMYLIQCKNSVRKLLIVHK
jgi:spore coat protein CotH